MGGPFSPPLTKTINELNFAKINMFLNFTTIQITALDNFWSILILFFGGGAPIRAPPQKN